MFVLRVLRQRAGDETCAEPGVGGGVHLQVAVAGNRRQVEGVGGLQDGAGLALRQGSQTDPVGQVGVEPAQFAAFDPLARQHQVHPDGASDPADGQEQLDEVGPGGQELAELVDDDQQVRERGQTQLGTFGAQRPVGGDVGDVPGVAQHLLASLHLAGQAGVDAFDEAGVVGQVRDDA